MCYNSFTGSAPNYFSELLQLYSPSLSLRSSSDLRILKFQHFNRKTHGFRSFSYFGPHIWNNLPQDVRHYFSPFLQKQVQDIPRLWAFQLNNGVLCPNSLYSNTNCKCVCVGMYVCVCVCACMCVCVCVCIVVHVCTMSSSCFHTHIFFLLSFTTFIISMYMYTCINLYCSVVWVTG